MKRVAYLSVAAFLLSAPLFAAAPNVNEKAVWSLEENYWRYVQSNDLESYRTLWHRDFLGWPLSSPEPVRKEHITGWIQALTDAGDTLKSYRLERLTSQATGNYVTITYRVHMIWAGKDGLERPGSLRVLHTWIRNPDHQWQIISGMAAAPDAQGH